MFHRYRLYGARVCPECDRTYPPNHGYPCGYCDRETYWTAGRAVDPLWRQKLNRFRQEQKAMADNENDTDAEVARIMADRDTTVAQWRYKEIAAAVGDVGDEVVWMLVDRGVDVEAARRLKRLGCPSGLALRILA